MMNARCAAIGLALVLTGCQDNCRVTPPAPQPGIPAADPAKPAKKDLTKQACPMFVDNVLELELPFDLNPDQASPTAMIQSPNLSALSPLGLLLIKYHARIQPSIRAPRALKLGLLRAYTVRFPPSSQFASKQLLTIRDEFRRLPATAVKRVGLVPTAGKPDDPLLGSVPTTTASAASNTGDCGTQWYVFRTKVDSAWKSGVSGRNVIVADVDWGFSKNHNDLVDAWDPAHSEIDICGNHSISTDLDEHHGTGVAAQIAARENKYGLKGIAYNAMIWRIKAACFNSDNKSCKQDWTGVNFNPWADGIAAAVTETCDGCRKVVLLETQTCCVNGNYEGSIAVQLAIQKAIQNGVVVVVAAGNGDKPADLDDESDAIPNTGSILVGATAYRDADVNPRHDLSNFGKLVTVAAPGDDDRDLTATSANGGPFCGSTSDPNDLYTLKFGRTSGAAAKVAGVVALMLEKNNKLTPPQVKCILCRSGDAVKTEASKPIGGFLNAARAVEMAAAPPAECPSSLAPDFEMTCPPPTTPP